MASKKALAIKEAKLEAQRQARWTRLELLILAIAEKAGIDVDAVLESVEGSKKAQPAPKQVEVSEEIVPQAEEKPKPKASKKKAG